MLNMVPSFSPQRGAAQQGGILIEVLVAIVVFSFGLLGLVGMQVSATQYALEAEDRGRAALFADDLAAQMRLSRSVSLSVDQIDDWTDRVRGVNPRTGDPTGLGLPNANVDVNADPAANRAVITITWRHPSQAEGAESRLVTEVVLSAEEVL